MLRWSAAIDDFSVDDYVVKRDGAQVGTPVTTDFTDTGLVPGTTVAYTVAAVDAGGNVGPAAGVSLVIPDTTPPGTPPRVTAKVTKDGPGPARLGCRAPTTAAWPGIASAAQAG